MIWKKIAIWCLIVVTCFTVAMPPVAWALEPGNGQVYQNYLKEENTDESEAGDYAWYRSNSAILTNHSIANDALRSIGFNAAKFLCRISNVVETLYDKTFGMIDLTKYGSVNALLTKLKPVLIALTCLCVAGLGITLIVRQEKVPLVRNILIGILAVSCSGYLFSAANNLAYSFKDGILTDHQRTQQSYTLLDQNIIDLVSIEKKGGIDALDYAGGHGISYGAGISTYEDACLMDINQTLDWYTAKNGKELYGWSENFNNKMKYHITKTTEGSTIAIKNYDGITTANIGNEFYYRFSFDFWSCALQLLALILLFCALSYKNVRLAYELVVSRILAFMYAADVSNGERLKSILLFIRDTYITLCVSVLCVRLYEIFTGAITSFGITGLGKGIVSLFIAYAVIDGPNLVERLLGMDAGLKSSVGRTMAMVGMARSAVRTGAHVGRGVKNFGAAAHTGKSAAERRQESGGASVGERIGKAAYQARHSRRNEQSSEDNFDRATKGQNNGGFTADFMGESSGKRNNDSTTPEAHEQTGKQTGFVDNSSAQMDEATQGSGKQSDKQTGFTPDFMGSSAENADSTAPDQHQQTGQQSISPDFIGGSRSNTDSTTPEAHEQTGKQTGFTPDFMGGTTAQTGKTVKPTEKPAVKARISNPAFSAAVKRLAPGETASPEERKDFNRQMNAIVRGKKHQAIKPPSDARSYQVKNYEKALELEREYRSYKKTNEKEDSGKRKGKLNGK